jgi:hypothetical protein
MRLVIASILSCALALSAKADVKPPPSFYARADELAEWIDLNSDYRPMQRHPVYIFLSQDQLNYVFFGTSAVGYVGTEQSEALALYHNGIVLLSSDFELGKNDDVLLHELVHHLQAEQNRVFPCVRAGEKDAYDLQKKFTEETGIGELPDPMWTLLVSQCGDF